MSGYVSSMQYEFTLNDMNLIVELDILCLTFKCFSNIYLR